MRESICFILKEFWRRWEVFVAGGEGRVILFCFGENLGVKVSGVRKRGEMITVNKYQMERWGVAERG